MRDGAGGYQRVLLVGGTSEIGLATVRALDLRHGARLLLAGRDPQRLRDAADAVARDRPHVTVTTTAYDAAGDDVDGLLAAVTEHLGELDLVLFAVGTLPDQRRDGLAPGSAVQALQVNLVGPVAALLALAPLLRAQGHGDVVVLSSIAAVRSRADSVVYGTGKAGLDAFATALGDALAGTGVRVLVVRPGFVVGRMTAGWRPAPLATSPERVAAAVVNGLRTGRETVWIPAGLRLVAAAMRVAPRTLWRRAAARVAQGESGGPKADLVLASGGAGATSTGPGGPGRADG